MASRAKWWPEPFSYDYTYLNSLLFWEGSPTADSLRELGEESKANFESLYSTFTLYNAENDINLGLTMNSVKELRTQARIERTKELEFLRELDLISEGNSAQTVGQIMLKFNQLYHNKTAFLEEVQKIKATPETGDLKYSHITKLFHSYLETSLNDWWKKGGSTKFYKHGMQESYLNQIVSSAFDKMLSSEGVFVNGQPYQETLEQIKKSPQYNWLISELGKLYNENLNSSIKNPVASLTKKGKPSKRKRQFKINYDYAKTGNVLEYYITAGLSQLMEQFKKNASKNLEITTGKVTHTGGANFNEAKPDVTLFYGNIEIDWEQFFGTDANYNSKVAKNAESWKQVHQSLQEKAKNVEEALNKYFLVEVSAKNYNINSDSWHGFSAQSETTLQNFSEILMAQGFSQSRLEELMFIMANLGERTIGQDKSTSDLGYYLSTLIGYFLFDDVDFSSSAPQHNAIHLFNLNGIYVPLSCFLYAAADAFENIKTYRTMANIHFIPADAHEAPATDQKQWERVRNRQLAQGKLTFSFFKDFATFIQTNLNDDILREWK